MNLDKFTAFSMIVRNELNKAEQKHPKFCDAMIDPSDFASVLTTWDIVEQRTKIRNERGPWTADNILMEEVAEAMNAYQQGDKAHALQELAQCGAVILRMMELVHNEIEVED